MPPAQPQQPPQQRSRLRVALVTVAVTLTSYLVVAGALGALAYSAEPGKPEGTVALPEEPCTTVTVAQLRSVSAKHPINNFYRYGSEETGSDEFSSATCAWYTTFSDGTLGSLSVWFEVPEDDPESVSEAKDTYRSRAGEYSPDIDSTRGEGVREVTVDDLRSPGLGDESLLAFAEHAPDSADGQDDESYKVAVLLVRHANILIDITAAENPEADQDGQPDLTGEEDVLTDMARSALARLE